MKNSPVTRIAASFLCLLAVACSAGQTPSAQTVVSQINVPQLVIEDPAAAGAEQAGGGQADEQGAGTGERVEPEAETKLRRMRHKEVTRAHGVKAKEILKSTYDEPMGAEIPFEVDGKDYVAKIENHYHEPGGPAKPWGWHRGISLFVVVPAS